MLLWVMQKYTVLCENIEAKNLFVCFLLLFWTKIWNFYWFLQVFGRYFCQISI